MAILENDVVFLRAVEPEDLELLYEWENDSSLWERGDTINPYSRFTIKLYIERALKENVLQIGQLRLMICMTGSGKVAGMVDLFDIDVINGKCGVGLLVADEYRGLGISGLALELVEEYSRQVLRLHQLYAHIAAFNVPCVNCFEKNGFVCSGVLKEWKRIGDGYADVLVYQKFL